MDALSAENRDLHRQLDAPASSQLVSSLVKGFSGQEALRLESVEEKVHCNSYKSHTDARFRLFGAPGRFRGAFPDIHNAKVEIATPEHLGEAIKAQFEFKPLQPLHTAITRLAIDAGELLGFRGAPVVVVRPDPPFLLNGRTRWNPQLEISGVADGGTEWEARYSVSNDGAVFRALEGEVRHAHPVYGDFAISRWLQEDDLERFRKYGDRYYEGGAGRSSPDPDAAAPAARARRSRGSPRASRTTPDSTPTTAATAPRRRGGRVRAGRSGARGSAAAAAEERLGGLPDLVDRLRRRRRGGATGAPAGAPARAGSGTPARRRRAGSRAGAGTSRGSRFWRRSATRRRWRTRTCTRAAGARARGRDHQQRRGVGDERHVGGGGVGAEAAPAANLDGRVSARFVAREVEAGMSYHFTEEFKGWHVNAKAILSPNGIATPEFTLHHVWDF